MCASVMVDICGGMLAYLHAKTTPYMQQSWCMLYTVLGVMLVWHWNRLNGMDDFVRAELTSTGWHGTERHGTEWHGTVLAIWYGMVCHSIA